MSNPNNTGHPLITRHSLNDAPSSLSAATKTMVAFEPSSERGCAPRSRDALPILTGAVAQTRADGLPRTRQVRQWCLAI